MVKKRVFSLIFAIGLAFTAFFYNFSPYSFHIVSADPIKYLRVVDQETPIYSDSSCSQLLFNLSYTYYVKILTVEGDVANVECFDKNGGKRIDGYVYISSLYDDGLEVSSPYPNLEIKTRTTAVLYQDAQLNTVSRYIFKDRVLTFIGSLKKDDSYIYFVCYNDDLGYVKEEDLYSFSLANHPNELTFISPPEEELPTDAPVTNESENQTLKIVIIACLVFAGVLALIFALKKQTVKKPRTEYYDDNDYS